MISPFLVQLLFSQSHSSNSEFSLMAWSLLNVVCHFHNRGHWIVRDHSWQTDVLVGTM